MMFLISSNRVKLSEKSYFQKQLFLHLVSHITKRSAELRLSL